MQKTVEVRQTSCEDDPQQAKLEISCLSDSPDFALKMADQDPPLPTPLKSALFPQPEVSCNDV